MQLLFFTAANTPLFTRDDAQKAVWQVEEYRLEVELPYNAAKVVTRGMRIAFVDDTNTTQFFECRKVATYEPGHYQSIVAEHIAVAELSDDHIARQEINNKTAAQALTTALSGTLWSVGNNTASGTQSADIAYGSVWDAVNTIQENWNVYITPRVTWGASGITGRYLDIAPATGTWRGVRLAIDKNADEMGVTYDDTETLTALYGYGVATDNAPLTFAGVTWTATDDHPAKPSGQTYLEDPAATAAYGRNGRARFGYYQNNNITSASVLLEKTWEALKATSQPRVTVECTVADLHRLGYVDQPLRLHDLAIVDVSPVGISLRLEIIQLEVNLLDPTQTRPTIGAYIPNIVYITRKNTKASSGRGGGGGRGQTTMEAEWSEYYTEITANNYNINLVATRVDRSDNILEQAGLSINSQGVLVYADDNVNMWQSKLNVQADRIGLVVEGSGENASIKAASITAAINNGGSTVTISADKIIMDGQTVATQIGATNANITNLTTGTTKAMGLWAATVRADALTVASSISLSSGVSLDVPGTFSINSENVTSRIISMDNVIAAGPTKIYGTTSTAIDLSHYHILTIAEGSGSDAGKFIVTIGTTTSTAGDGQANFNIAATQTYINGVAAATTSGYNSGWGDAWALTGMSSAQSSTNTMTIYVPPQTPGSTSALSITLTVAENGSSGNDKYVDILIGGTTYARTTVTGGGTTQGYNDGWAAAYSRVSYPTSANPSSTTLTVTVPYSTVDSSAMSLVYALRQNAWSGKTKTVDIQGNSSGTVYARTTVDASSIYDNGWAAARTRLSIPTSAGTSISYAITYPSATVDSTAATQTYYLTADSDLSSNTAYAKLHVSSTTGTTVAQVSIKPIYDTGYSRGWSTARGKIAYDPSTGYIVGPAATAGQAAGVNFYKYTKETTSRYAVATDQAVLVSASASTTGSIALYYIVDGQYQYYGRYRQTYVDVIRASDSGTWYKLETASSLVSV